MSVYVDRLRSMGSKTSLKRWCKMWADTDDERYEMSVTLGLSPLTKQVTAGHKHYEITPDQRQRALNAGALIYTVREWKFDRKHRK